MKIANSHFLLILWLFSFAYMLSSCECFREDYGRVNYSVSLLPLAATYGVGDTLVLRMEMDPMFEFTSGFDTLDNSNLPVSINFDLFEGREGEPEVLPARDNFDYVAVAGRYSDRASRGFTVDIYDDCSETNCELALGFIPQRPGYFGIALGVGWADVSECYATRLDPLGIENSTNNNSDVFAEIDLEVTQVDDRFFFEPERFLYFFRVME